MRDLAGQAESRGPAGIRQSMLRRKAIGFDIAFQERIYESRTIASNLNPTVDGNYHATIHLGTVFFDMRH